MRPIKGDPFSFTPAIVINVWGSYVPHVNIASIRLDDDSIFLVAYVSYRKSTSMRLK